MAELLERFARLKKINIQNDSIDCLYDGKIGPTSGILYWKQLLLSKFQNIFSPEKEEFFIFWTMFGGVILYKMWFIRNLNILKLIIYMSILQAVFFEYIALYYEAVAKRTSVLNKGLPEKCMSDSSIGFFKKLSFYVQNTVTFQTDECHTYYRSMFVLPIFDVSLLESISRVFKKFVFSYFTEFAQTIGNSIYLLLHKFPIQWQFIVFASFLILVIFFMCLLFRIELSTLFFTIKFNRPIQTQSLLNSNCHTVKMISTESPDKIQKSKTEQKLIRSYSLGNLGNKRFTL